MGSHCPGTVGPRQVGDQPHDQLAENGAGRQRNDDEFERSLLHPLPCATIPLQSGLNISTIWSGKYFLLQAPRFRCGVPVTCIRTHAGDERGRGGCSSVWPGEDRPGRLPLNGKAFQDEKIPKKLQPKGGGSMKTDEMMANRKLIRPSLAELKDSVTTINRVKRRKQVPPEQTNAENYYYLKQMSTNTAMVIVLRDGESIHGVIEWYDKTCLKVNRETEPNLLIMKRNIKYMYKESEAKKSSEPIHG
jgi:host factor-I protein